VNPISRERLEKTLARVAREHGLDQERLRRWVSFLALCGVLERAIHESILNRYYLKGGVAMELRFAEAARATKDLDLGLDGDRAYRLSSFAAALQLGFDEFTFRLRPQTHHMELADTVRIEVAILYKTRGWQTVDVDLGPPGSENADLVNPAIIGLAEMGLPVTTPIRCLNLSEQVAQKLHACTGPASSGRARDVLDILLIDSLGKLDYAQTCVAVERVFKQRATHHLPRAFEIPTDWRLELESLASTLHSPLKTADEISERFRAILEKLAIQAPHTNIG
jgi:predicted nucleotidyltransferase component of viral defense system